MKATQIPIRATHAEARKLLEAAHTISYRDTILGMNTRAECTCGYNSPWVNFGPVAQGHANRHLLGRVEYELEERRRYAIYRDRSYGRWTILDRENGDEYGPLGTDDLAGCFTTLANLVRQEPTA